MEHDCYKLGHTKADLTSLLGMDLLYNMLHNELYNKSQQIEVVEFGFKRMLTAWFKLSLSTDVALVEDAQFLYDVTSYDDDMI